MEGYSGSFAKAIKEGFERKGWNLYDSSERRASAENIIRKKLANSIERNGCYVLLPKVSNPNDPEMVFDALKNLSEKLNNKQPTIEILGEKIEMIGMSTLDNDIKIHSPDGLHVGYRTFLRSLYSFPEGI